MSHGRAPAARASGVRRQASSLPSGFIRDMRRTSPASSPARAIALWSTSKLAACAESDGVHGKCDDLVVRRWSSRKNGRGCAGSSTRIGAMISECVRAEAQEGVVRRCRGDAPAIARTPVRRSIALTPSSSRAQV